MYETPVKNESSCCLKHQGLETAQEIVILPTLWWMPLVFLLFAASTLLIECLATRLFSAHWHSPIFISAATGIAGTFIAYAIYRSRMTARTQWKDLR